jgi:excisionase family DNA binding protein
VRQVAAFLSVNTRVVYDLVRRGDLKSIRVSNAVRIPKSAVVDFTSR